MRPSVAAAIAVMPSVSSVMSDDTQESIEIDVTDTVFEGRKLTECTVTTGTSELVLKGEDQHDVVCVHARSVRFFAARDRLL